MPVVRARDADLYVEVEGEGPPVTVFAHGLTNNRNELAAFTPLLPGTKVRFDFRGHGRSTAPEDPSAFGFADLGRDLDAVARAYGATVAVGTSLGAGAIANLLAVDPDRFERTVWLLPAALDRPFAFRERYDRLAVDLEGKTPQEALDVVLSDPERVAEYLRTPWMIQVDRLLWDHDDPDALARAVRGAVRDFPVADREVLRRVANPVLLICIEGDEIHPVELGRILADVLGNAELIEYPSQDALLSDIPSLVPRVATFISGNARADAGVQQDVSELEEFRAEKDAFFRDDARSPLTADQRAAFRGLSYYPEDGRLRIEGVLDTEVDRTEEIAMATSTGGTQTYRRAGKVRFDVEGQTAEITLYASSDMPELFVPFRDATSGTETYGAGRYLEVDPPGPGGRVLVDFNLAYNPYCCYNESWSCPIPPRENWLDVPIRAGEKDFDGDVARAPA